MTTHSSRVAPATRLAAVPVPTAVQAEDEGSCLEPEPTEALGWLLLPTEAVPERWARRAVSWSLVPLLPGEFAALQSGSTPRVMLDAIDERLAHLVARGMLTRDIARELGVSDRTVQRRLVRLRRLVGAATKAELAIELARRGF